jgi:mannose/fructose-specific phosphotransferase system component IIA
VRLNKNPKARNVLAAMNSPIAVEASSARIKETTIGTRVNIPDI